MARVIERAPADEAERKAKELEDKITYAGVEQEYDLRKNRVKVEGMEQRGTSQVIRSQVPLSEMFGYATDLRSRTQGRATYTMQFDSYQPVPESISQEIIARVRGE